MRTRRIKVSEARKKKGRYIRISKVGSRKLLEKLLKEGKQMSDEERERFFSRIVNKKDIPPNTKEWDITDELVKMRKEVEEEERREMRRRRR